jgi:putative copper export protein
LLQPEDRQDGVVIPVTWESVRVSVHVLAATVWLGGQIVLAALVPALRAYGRDVVRAAARRFNLVAWPAYGVLVATGVGNVIATGLGGGAYRPTLVVKVVLVAVSGLAAYLHLRARTPAAIAGFGALSPLAGIGAAVLGVLLGSGGRSETSGTFGQ